METEDNSNIYLVILIIIEKHQTKNIEKFEININNIKKIKELKYFIIKQYKKQKFCPCQLMFSDFYKTQLYCSKINDTPEKNIDECFPNHEIYTHVNSDKSCDCGFEELNSLSKYEIYEKYMEKINKLTFEYEKIINEKDIKIKDLELTIAELLDNIDNLNNMKKIKLMEYIRRDKNNIVKFNQYDDNINFEEFYDIIININSI